MLRFFKNTFILCCVLLYGSVSLVFCKNNDLQIYDSIIKQFQHEGNLFDAQPYGMGLINKTYLVKTKSKDGKINKYLLQNINNNVFPNVDKMMVNIDLVTSYLRKILIDHREDFQNGVLTLINTINNELYYEDQCGKYWRMYVFIDNTISYSKPKDNKMLENLGRAFGKFIHDLSGFHADKLYEVITNFHNTKSRFSDFKKAVSFNYDNRAENVKEEIEFVFSREKYISQIIDKLDDGSLPLRVVHNDTKLNNVLFDINDSNRIVCVVDLDTVMPGSLLYDFGDAVRSSCNITISEDFTRASFDLKLFEYFTKGFLEEVGDIITNEEKNMLPIACIIMTYECGMRFLSDYLNGDVYFKINTPSDNLARCRKQFNLLRDMEGKIQDMQMIVNKYC